MGGKSGGKTTTLPQSVKAEPPDIMKPYLQRAYTEADVRHSMKLDPTLNPRLRNIHTMFQDGNSPLLQTGNFKTYEDYRDLPGNAATKMTKAYRERNAAILNKLLGRS